MNKHYWIIIFATLIIACNPQQNKNLRSENEYDLFQDLAIVETGLDFPPSQDHLETCQRIKDIPCLSSFDSFKESKAKLLQMTKHDALELTLKWLGDSCMVEPPGDFEYVCIGTLMALYFFPEETEDTKIRQFVSQLPQSTRDNVFHRSVSLGLCWLENRSDKIAWKSWLESNLSDSRVKSHAIYRLEKPAPKSDPLLMFPYNNNM
jgi:hypothetical protein